MNYSRISLSTKAGISLALSNEFPNAFKVYDAVEDAVDGNDLVNRLKRVKSYLKAMTLDRETENLVRIKCISHMCNNVSYLVIRK